MKMTDFFAAKELVYNPCQFKCSPPVMEPESAEYGACTFELNDFSIRSTQLLKGYDI